MAEEVANSRGGNLYSPWCEPIYPLLFASMSDMSMSISLRKLTKGLSAWQDFTGELA